MPSAPLPAAAFPQPLLSGRAEPSAPPGGMGKTERGLADDCSAFFKISAI